MTVQAGRYDVLSYRSANQLFQRHCIDLFALVNIDGAPGIAAETGIEQPSRIRQRGALAKVIFTTLLCVSPVQIMPS
jgi:hypothetical protein